MKYCVDSSRIRPVFRLQILISRCLIHSCVNVFFGFVLVFYEATVIDVEECFIIMLKQRIKHLFLLSIWVAKLEITHQIALD